MGEQKVFIVLLVLCSLLVFSPEIGVSKAESRTLVVPDDYVTLQEAVDVALVGDTVFVKSGTYDNQELVINKTLSLVGEDPKTTFLLGKPDVYFPQTTTIINIDANDVYISGFTLLPYLAVGGICSTGNRTRIENSIIHNVQAGAGISLWGNNNTVAYNNLTNGVYISCFGSHNTITENYIYHASGAGITIDGPFNTISKNNMTNAGNGIEIDGNSNTVTMNNIRNGTTGIHLHNCSNNFVYGNNVTDNWFTGIHLYVGSNNLIYDNYIANNIDDKNGYGISLSGTHYHAENNTFYCNTLINNSHNFRIEEPYYPNLWDNGYAGNYWDDYTGVDTDGDGIGTSPYVLSENNRDNYPLVKPLTTSDFQFPDTTSPTIVVDTLQNETYTTNSVSFTFTVDEEASWMGYSLDGEDNVTATENTVTLTGLPNGVHNITVYANDTSGNTGKSETISFTVDVPPATWMITVLAVAIAAVAVVTVLVYFRKTKKKPANQSY